MRWARQASAAKHAYLHSEISAVFLRHQISGSLRSAKQGVYRTVNPAILIDSVIIFRARVVPSRFELFQRQLVRRISIHLVCAKQREHRLWRMEPRAFQQMDGAKRIHFKIQNRNIFRLIVRWLCRAMYYQIEPMGAEHILKFATVPYIHVVVNKFPRRLFQPLQIPRRVPGFPEEYPAHIVINSVPPAALPIEIFDRFRANQTTGAGNQNCLRSHDRSSILPAEVANPWASI